MSSMRRYTVVGSDAVRSLGYDQHRHELDVEYPSGDVYRYEDVPPQEIMALMKAESLGTFINARIKPRYRYRKLDN